MAGLSDREQIIEVLVAYSAAHDSHVEKDIVQCFTDDAINDYTSFFPTAIDHDPADFARNCAASLQGWTTCHQVTNFTVTVDGDSATSVCYHIGQHVKDATNETTLIWGKFHDKFVRTDTGWKIAHRRYQHIHASSEHVLESGKSARHDGD